MRYETAEKPFKAVTDKFTGDDAIPVGDTKYRQYDTLDEAITDAGGQDKLLEYVNRSVKSDSLIGVRNYMTSIKKKTDVSKDTIISKVRELREKFSLAASAIGKVSKAEKVEQADSVNKFVTELPEGASVTREQLLALLEAARKN